MKTSDTTGWTGIPGINRWREAGGIMKDFFLYLMIYAGSVLMAYNIYRYVCFSRDVRKLLPLRDRYGDRSQPLLLNMHMNHGIHITLPDRKVQMYDRDFDTYMRFFERFRTLCEQWIGDGDIRIAVENTDGFRGYEKKAVEYLLRSPVFGLTWDIGHSKATGEKDVPFLLEHSERLIHFHIHDGTENPPGNHLALGDGDIDLAERLRLAERRNARCVLETKTVEALKKSVEWLRQNHFC